MSLPWGAPTAWGWPHQLSPSSSQGSQYLAEAQGTVSACLHCCKFLSSMFWCVWGHPGYSQVRYMTSTKPLFVPPPYRPQGGGTLSE